MPGSFPEALILIHDSTNLGGAELHLLNILKTTQSLGIRNYLITPSKGSLFQQFEALVEGYCISPIPRPRKLKTAFTYYPFIKTCKQFIQSIEAKSSCILVGDLYPLWASIKLGKTSQTPVYSLWQGEYDFSSHECIQKWARYGANNADKLIANTFIKQHIEANRLLHKEILPLDPKVDTNTFSKENHNRESLRKSFGWEDRQVAVCVGRYGEGKGQPWLIDSFLKDRTLKKTWKLVIAGPISEGDRNKLASILNKENADQPIEILGERADIAEIYAASDLAVFPGTVQESFGLSMIEAALMELPVIALKQGALPYIFGDDYPGLIPKDERSSIITLIKTFDKSSQFTNSQQTKNLKESILGIFSNFELQLKTILGDSDQAT
ncbi:MAG: hypothetical protein Tsb0018_01560 [Opitutales bacterium]